MEIKAKELIDRVAAGESPDDVLTEIVKVVKGKRKTIDPKKSRAQQKAAKKRSPAQRKAAAKKGARKKGHGGRKAAARKAQRTKKKFGSIGASAVYSPDSLIAEWANLRDAAPDEMTEFKQYCEDQIEFLQTCVEDDGLWEAEGVERIDHLSSLIEAVVAPGAALAE
jgi:hypothetical protein